MPHRLLTLLSAVCLLLCLATACMWTGMLHAHTALRCGRGHTEYIVRLQWDAGIMFQTMRWTRPLAAVYQTPHLPLIRTGVVDFMFCPGGRTSGTRLLGFEAIRREACDPGGSVVMIEHRAIIPFWSATLLFAALPTLWLARTRSDLRRLRLNLCPTCSYDLRASKDRCPECGSPIPQITNNQ